MNSQKPKSKNPARIAIALVALYAGSMVMLSACNTVEGAGKDIKAAGNSIEDTAQDAKN